jgi:hypothetical protein
MIGAGRALQSVLIESHGPLNRGFCGRLLHLLVQIELDLNHSSSLGCQRNDVTEQDSIIRYPRAVPAPAGPSRASTLELEMLIRKKPVGEHITWTGLNGVLRQEPGREFRRRFPHTRVQSGIQMSIRRPNPHQPNPAIELGPHCLRPETRSVQVAAPVPKSAARVSPVGATRRSVSPSSAQRTPTGPARAAGIHRRTPA